jgi:hypothetical protein
LSVESHRAHLAPSVRFRVETFFTDAPWGGEYSRANRTRKSAQRARQTALFGHPHAPDRCAPNGTPRRPLPVG